MADNNYLDQNGVLYLWQKIVAKITNMIVNKVDKVDGKGLSTNDYTTVEKTKLDGVATGAQVNKIEIVKVNGTALTPVSSKAVNVDFSAYAKSADVTIEIASAVTGVNQIDN